MNDESNSSDPIEAAIAALRAKREQIDQAIRVLESLGEGAASAGISLPPPGGTVALHANGLSVGGIAAGAFHGKSIEDATETILQLRKRTLGAAEIVADLQTGGLHFRGATPVNTVTSVLHRASKKGGKVVRIGRGAWGLREWYPNRKFD